MQKIIYSAPGKIHLLGEHAVVYAKPAILAAVNLRCRVELILSKDKSIEIVFNKNDKINKKDLNYINLSVQQAFKFYKTKPKNCFKLIIDTKIPIGSGLGSSAAFSVALAACITEYLKKPFDKNVINEVAFSIEKIFHGNPSGGDNSTSCFGGLIWYRKKNDFLKIIQPVPFSLVKSVANKFFIIDSGKPEESTGEMVEKVGKLYKKNKRLVEEFTNAQEKLTVDLLEALKMGDDEKIISIIKTGEENLEKIGVVSKYSKSIIRKIEKAGGAAKICGGGGVKKGTGIILVFIPKKPNVIFDTFQLTHVSLGAEGLRSEAYTNHKN